MVWIITDNYLFLNNKNNDKIYLFDLDKVLSIDENDLKFIYLYNN